MTEQYPTRGIKRILLYVLAAGAALAACGDDDDDTDYEDQPGVEVPAEVEENLIVNGAVPPGALDSRYEGHAEFGVWSDQLDPQTNRLFRCLYSVDYAGNGGGPAMWCYEISGPGEG